VWIGAGGFVHPGVKIGDNVFINSKSVVKEDIPSGRIIEGFPAKQVGSIEMLKRPMTPGRLDIVCWQMLKYFTEVILRRKWRLEFSSDNTNRVDFDCGLHKYSILFIPSDGQHPAISGIDRSRRIIFMSNRNGWAATPEIKKPMVIDMVLMQIQPCRDKVYNQLHHFMKRYYGVNFEYRD